MLWQQLCLNSLDFEDCSRVQTEGEREREEEMKAQTMKTAGYRNSTWTEKMMVVAIAEDLTLLFDVLCLHCSMSQAVRGAAAAAATSAKQLVAADAKVGAKSRRLFVCLEVVQK